MYIVHITGTLIPEVSADDAISSPISVGFTFFYGDL
jgi:hypothetical protein